MSQRHQDPVVSKAIDAGEEILLKYKLNKIDRKKLNQENDTQGVKKNKEKGEDLMYFDSDVETSDKKNSNLEAPKVKPSLQKTKESNKDPLHTPKSEAQKSPGVNSKIKKLYSALKEFLLKQSDLSEDAGMI